MIDELEWFARNMADWPDDTISVYRDDEGRIMRVIDPEFDPLVQIGKVAVYEGEWQRERDRLFRGRIDIIGQNGNDGEHYDQAVGIGGGLKWDRDKPRMDLLMQGMPRALESVGEVLTLVRPSTRLIAGSWWRMRQIDTTPPRYGIN